MNVWILLIAIAFMAGILIPVQAGINAQVGRMVGHPLLGSLISFCVGTLGLFCVCLIMGLKLPTLAQVQQIPPWLWIGGLLGAFFVTSSILLAPKLGATTMVGLIVAGQLFSAVTLDHFGWVGYAVHPVSPGRIIGIVLLLGGMVLIQRF